MLNINRYNFFRLLSILFIFAAGGLAVFELIHFSRLRTGFPPGTKIAGVPVGGLNQNEAAERLNQVFNNPIEIVYGDARIQVKPSTLGFSIDTVGMIAAADQQRVSMPFWQGFSEFLWNQVSESSDTPIRYTLEEKRLRIYLSEEISARYDKVPQTSIGIPGTISFQLGVPGEVLNIEQAVLSVEKALRNPFDRSVELPVDKIEPPRPSLANLEIQLKQVLDWSGFDGLTEIYLLDLQSREELNFAYSNGTSYKPGIAFTAASTVKIPIMVSVFRRLTEPTPTRALELMNAMIAESNNPPADALMNEFITNNIGPNLITADMRELGLSNTFLAGMFYLGAPLLNRYSTNANTRTDYTTDPDTYNQTTTYELGILLDDIYQCAETGGGNLALIFPGEITQTECQTMITFLLTNKIGQLLQAGLPDGIKMAHKHGWIVETDGVIHTILDAGIVYTPGGNYVIVAAMYQPTQLIYDVANRIQAQLSTAIYNYFNIQ